MAKATNVDLKKLKHVIYSELPEKYRRASGVYPYYIPAFGAIYRKRLDVALHLAQKYSAQDVDKIADIGCGLGVFTAL